MSSSLRVNSIIPSSGTNVAIGTAGGTISYNASVSGVSTFSSGITIGTGASISSPATNVLTLGTNNSERVRIDSSGRLGIGTNDPTNTLHVVNSSYPTLSADAGSNKELRLQFHTGDNTANVASIGAFPLVFQTNSIERLRIDSSGRVTKPNQPAFSVYPAAGTPIGSGTIIFTGVRFNIGSHYSTSTGRFTAPVSGIYLIVLTSQHYGGTATNGWIDIRINGAEVNARYETFDGAQYTAGGISAIVQMSADDYATIVTSANIFHDDNTNFSGYLLG